MIFYWLFLCLAPFQDHPIFGATLFQAGFLPITPIKVAGVLSIVAAVLDPKPRYAAGQLSSPVGPLYAVFALYPLLSTLCTGKGVPGASLSALLSFSMLLIATRALVCTPQRLLGSVRVLVFAEAAGTLWLFKQYYILHWDIPVGPSSDANYEALALVMVLPLAVFLVLSDSSRLSRVAAILILPLIFFGLVVSQSRGGLLALAVMGVLVWLRCRRKAVMLAGFLLALLLGVVLGPTATWRRFQEIRVTGEAETGAEVSTRTRVELWRGGIAMIRANPVFGVGLDRFKLMVGRYNPKLYDVIDQNYIAHNTYVQLAAEGGLPTLALFLASGLAGIGRLRKCECLVETDSRLRLLATAMRLGIYSFGVAGLFLTAQFQKEFWLYVFLSSNVFEMATAEERDRRGREIRTANGFLNGESTPRLSPPGNYSSASCQPSGWSQTDA